MLPRAALDGGYRNARLRLYNAAVNLPVLAKLGAAVGVAGLTAAFAQLSVPVPWTPVPLTFQILGFTLAGVFLGSRYGVISMLIYVGAGAAGLHVFAPSDDAFNPDTFYSAERWRILVPDAAAKTGFTAGYLLGFPVAAWFVGSYMRRRAAGDGTAFARYAAFAFAGLLVAVAAGAFFLGGGNSFAADDAQADDFLGWSYRTGVDYAWLFAAAFLVVAPLVAWLLVRRRGGVEALNLFVVLLGAVAIVHALGVVVLKLTLGLSWTVAVALGSTVFLPFDALKAAIAVALTPAFLPSPGDSS